LGVTNTPSSDLFFSKNQQLFETSIIPWNCLARRIWTMMRGVVLGSRRYFSAPANTVEVFINEKSVKVAPGTTILQAAAEAGIEIPR
jgi:hypothetical protein